MAGAMRGRRFTVPNHRRFPLTIAIAMFALVHLTSQQSARQRRWTMAHSRSRGVLKATGVRRIGRVRTQFHSTTPEEMVPEASKTSPTAPIVVQIGEIVRIDRLADHTVDDSAKEIDHFRAKFFGCDRINDNIHRVIEIHQNNTEDLDQNEKRLSMVVVLVSRVGINAQKDHDRRSQTDENQIDGDQHHRYIPTST